MDTAAEDCLNAYREGRILIDSVGFLMDYAFALPVPDGMTAAQWEQADLGTRRRLPAHSACPSS